MKALAAVLVLLAFMTFWTTPIGVQTHHIDRITVVASHKHHHRRHRRRPHPAPLPPKQISATRAIQIMQAMAPGWWGGLHACHDNYQVTIGPIDGGSEQIVGQAWWHDVDGNPADYDNCSIIMNSQYWPTPMDLYANWAPFCQVFLHEFGHLTGHQHVSDPNNIMYPVATDQNQPAACKTPPPAG